MDISIVIPLYNSEKTIRECVCSILDSDFDKQFEIIMVDDGSTDGSMERIKDLDVKIIRQENKGAASARNTGAREAASALIVFVDSDIVFFKDTLKRLYGHLERDDVDYVSPRYSRKPLNRKWIHKYKALQDYVYFYDSIFTREQKQGPIKHAFLTGGVEGYKKKVFDELGGFDEKIKGANIEREKLFLKLAQKYTMLADGNIRTMHYFPDFIELVRIYFKRPFCTMDLVHMYGYNQPYLNSLKKNILRVMLGLLSILLLCVSFLFCIIFSYAGFFIVPAMVFLMYLAAHYRMFILAYKDNGFLFMVYTLIVNLFFCSLISTVGFLGALKNIVRKLTGLNSHSRISSI